MTKAISVFQEEPFGELKVEEVELGKIDYGYVLVKMKYAGVCASNMHRLNQKQNAYPYFSGHEGSGFVEIAYGCRDIKEGDTVVLSWVPRRKTDRPFWHPNNGEVLSEGVHAWSNFIIAPEEYFTKIPSLHSFRPASIIGCSVQTGWNAVRRAGDIFGRTVAIFGAGGVGLSAIQSAMYHGAKEIIVVEPGREKRQNAEKFGATMTIDPLQEEVIPLIKDCTNGGVDFSFDTSGSDSAAQSILDVVRRGSSGYNNRGGIATLVGVGAKTISVSAESLLFGQKMLRGSLGECDPEIDFPLLSTLNDRAMFDIDNMISDVYSINGINGALEDLRAGKILGRGIIEF